MRNKVLTLAVTGLIFTSLIICGILIAVNRTNIGKLDEGSVIRTVPELSSGVHYFDSEAIALADTSNNKASLRSEALRAFNLVNKNREEAGLPCLKWDVNLENTSDVRARECGEKFSHTRPNNQPWYTVNSDIMGGENLAFGFNDANSVLKGWMDSTSHRENILYPDFTKVSISIYKSDDGTYYWAQEFGY